MDQVVTQEAPMTVVSTERLADVFVEVADTLVDEYDAIEFLQMVTDHIADLIGASDVGLLLADQRDRLQFMVASSESVKALELFQVQNQEGPCLDAFQSGRPVVNADLAEANDRWPLFAPRAASAGFLSVHAIPMRLRSEVIGAINVFGTEVGRLGAADVKIVQALADVATIGLLQERAVGRAESLSEQLQSVLNSRFVVEQAKGAISQFGNISIEEAFKVLRSHARRSRRRLSELAQAVVTDPATMAELFDQTQRAPRVETERNH
jgi:transcriptional regulator with GAF, ATPase, and Fis domain